MKIFLINRRMVDMDKSRDHIISKIIFENFKKMLDTLKNWCIIEGVKFIYARVVYS